MKNSTVGTICDICSFRIRPLTVTEPYAQHFPLLWAAWRCRATLQELFPCGTEGLWFVLPFYCIPRPQGPLVFPAHQVWIPSIRGQRVNECVSPCCLLVVILCPLSFLAFSHPAVPSALMADPAVVGLALHFCSQGSSAHSQLFTEPLS